MLGLFSLAGAGSSGDGPVVVKGGKRWLQALAPKFQGFLDIVPEDLKTNLGSSPIDRALLREHTLAKKLQKMIRRDLKALVAAAAEGGPRLSQQELALAYKLEADVVPDSWRKSRRAAG